MDDTVDTQHSYIRNPDVVLREEDEDGALLFNPDTDQIRVLNLTGLFVWKSCDGSQDLPGILAAMQDAFDQVPDDEVAAQIQEFVDEMVTAGFLSTVGE
jgi:hypothetical protein